VDTYVRGTVPNPIEIAGAITDIEAAHGSRARAPTTPHTFDWDAFRLTALPPSSSSHSCVTAAVANSPCWMLRRPELSALLFSPRPSSHAQCIVTRTTCVGAAPKAGCQRTRKDPLSSTHTHARSTSTFTAFGGREARVGSVHPSSMHLWRSRIRNDAGRNQRLGNAHARGTEPRTAERRASSSIAVEARSNTLWTPSHTERF